MLIGNSRESGSHGYEIYNSYFATNANYEKEQKRE
jgi:hypothetical protein